MPCYSILIYCLQTANWPTAVAAIIQIILSDENIKVQILPTGLTDFSDLFRVSGVNFNNILFNCYNKFPVEQALIIRINVDYF